MTEASEVRDAVAERATHLTHFGRGHHDLYPATNEFLAPGRAGQRR